MIVQRGKKKRGLFLRVDWVLNWDMGWHFK